MFFEGVVLLLDNVKPMYRIISQLNQISPVAPFGKLASRCIVRSALVPNKRKLIRKHGKTMRLFIIAKASN